MNMAAIASSSIPEAPTQSTHMWTHVVQGHCLLKKSASVSISAMSATSLVSLHAVLWLQSMWSEECLISKLNELAREKAIPDYPALRKGAAESA